MFFLAHWLVLIHFQSSSHTLSLFLLAPNARDEPALCLYTTDNFAKNKNKIKDIFWHLTSHKNIYYFISRIHKKLPKITQIDRHKTKFLHQQGAS